MYENEGIFDRFNVSWSPKGDYISTGSYNDSFNVIEITNAAVHGFKSQPRNLLLIANHE
jgi:hypothetical protein